MPVFVVSLERKNKRHFVEQQIRDQLEYIVGRAIGGARKVWSCAEADIQPPVAIKGGWFYKITLTFERSSSSRVKLTPERLSYEMQQVLNFMNKAASSSKFKQLPWELKNPTPDWLGEEPFEYSSNSEDAPKLGVVTFDSDPTTMSVESGKEMIVSDVVDFDRAIELSEIEIPRVLIEGSDDEIENHQAFEGIYGRAAHIRVMFSSIQTMIDTRGLRRNHVLLYGLPGCAKSSLFMGMQRVLPRGSYLSLNANSATKAGIEAIFLDRLHETGVPPFMFVEEIEKTLEVILTVWLSILDERAEVRKITHHQARKQEARILCFATANDKLLFDRLMGGRPGHPGALSSRFTKPLYVPRPDWEIMKRILLRDIRLYGGDERWADECISIAKEIGTNDPRTVLSFLDGGDRLLSGGYKDDIIKIDQMEKADKKRSRGVSEEEPEESEE